MIFSERIRSINSTDKVLEIGPGGTPYHRSDVFLEKNFDKDDLKRQRGNTPELTIDKPIVYYDGGRFPFNDDEFDYVICSHVLEHIPEKDFAFFVNELQRVAKKGYIEYPTIYYEYLYNFNVHTTFLNFKDNTIYYMDKKNSHLNSFKKIQVFFYRSLECGYDEIIQNNKEYFFQGFEWSKKINILQTNNVNDMIIDSIELKYNNKNSIKLNFSTLMYRLLKKVSRW